MTTMPTQLGSYTIDREIGRGGMGVVYLGHDTKLDRPVAIKALPEHLAADKDRLERFEREARTLASLTHANVAGIYGVEEADGAKYLVLEYVEGETLAQRLDRGPLEIDEALEVCAQIAAGVEAAHEAGVVHRDLKPGNVKITPDGKVKVLDFGLAKASESMSSSGSGLSEVPTLSIPATPHSLTAAGAILGTAPYMSPEQARGRAVDKRTDIWSFGVVLYECLTGASPFVGETASDSIGAILHKHIDLDHLPSQTPRIVRHVLERCLERDKLKRLRDIGDARLELEAARAGTDVETVGSDTEGSKLPLPAIIMAVVLVGVVALYVGTMLSPVPEPGPLIYSELRPPSGTRLISTGDLAGPVAVSPDGTMLTFTAVDDTNTRRLFLRRMDEAHARPLLGTDGGFFPFWSPDSRSIGFFIPDSMRRIDIATGATLTLCPASGGRGGAWLPDGTIIFSPRYLAAIYRVSANGGDPTPLTEIDAALHTSHRWPVALPDGKHFMYLAITHDLTRRAQSAVYLGSLDGTAPREVMRSNFSVEVIDDQLLFIREGTLFAATLDVNSAALTSDPKPIVRGVQSDESTWKADFSASDSGLLAYHATESGPGQASIAPTLSAFSEADSVLLMDRSGQELQYIADALPQISMSLSRDGTLLAVSIAQVTSQSYDIWIYPARNRDEVLADPTARADWLSSSPRRLTSLPGVEANSTFSPDGSELAFGVIYGDDDLGVYRIPLDGGRATRIYEVAPGEPQAWPTDWTRDGKYIICVVGNWIGFADGGIMALPTDGSEPINPIGKKQGLMPGFDGVVSPNGKWLAYTEVGQVSNGIMVVPFAPGWAESNYEPNAPFFNSTWRISSSAAALPKWRADGTELYFMTSEGDLMVASVDIESEIFSFGPPTLLTDTRWDPGTDFAPSPNGETFLLQVNQISSDAPISLVINWRRLLER